MLLKALGSWLYPIVHKAANIEDHVKGIITVHRQIEGKTDLRQKYQLFSNFTFTFVNPDYSFQFELHIIVLM